MSYSIGQYRYNNSDTYYTTVSSNDEVDNNNNYDVDLQDSTSNTYIFSGINFSYKAILNTNDLSNDNNYYLKFQYINNNIPTTLLIQINNNNQKDDILTLSASPNFLYFLDISPKFSGKINIWSTDTSGTIKYNIYQIENIISSLTSNKLIKKIGIQGAPHLPVWINNNCIRLNKNGIYELHNGIDITSVGVFPDANNPFFLIDYEY